MRRDELIRALRRLRVETGSLACLGCGHEHSCGVHGCAIINGAIEALVGTSVSQPDANRCVCCDAEIPEGRMVCPQCEAKAEDVDADETSDPRYRPYGMDGWCQNWRRSDA